MTSAVPEPLRPTNLMAPTPFPTADQRRSVDDIRAEMRAQPVISAPGDFAVTLELLDRVERLQQLGESLVRMVEAESGLRRSEFMVLRALDNGESHPRRVGRAVGLQTDAVLTTAESLASSGLLGINLDDDGRAVALVLTDSGRSILSQAEAVQIRATDAAIQHVGPEGAARAITVLDNIIEAMAPITSGDLPESVSDLPTGA